jgi:hypothetical protein
MVSVAVAIISGVAQCPANKPTRENWPATIGTPVVGPVPPRRFQKRLVDHSQALKDAHENLAKGMRTAPSNTRIGGPPVGRVGQSAARVFGWDKGPQTAVQYNEFRISQEQLEQMRALCDKPFKKPAFREEKTGV